MSRDEDCRRQGRPGRAGVVLGLAAALAPGCRDEPAEDPTRDDPVAIGTTSGTPGESTGELFIPGDEASDQCTLAPTVGAGRHHGTLRGAASELDGACGRMGPDVFFRLEVPRRSDIWFQGFGVGFSPRVGVLPHTCSTDWVGRTLACTEGVGTWLLDVAAGSSLVVSVGIDPEHPALDQAAPMEGDDPLDFALDVVTRDVLAEGDLCEPASRGRCGSGLACLVPPAEDPDAPPADAVCTAVAGDTCQTAIEVSVPIDPAGTTVEIDPATLQTDAHAHSCGGARARERVLRLRLPEPGPHGLQARVDHPEVGLALRAPGCLAEHEVGCADPVGIAGTLAAEISGSEAFLFVELPDPPEDDADGTGGSDGGETDGMGEEAPILVDIERFEPDPFE